MDVKPHKFETIFLNDVWRSATGYNWKNIRQHSITHNNTNYIYQHKNNSLKSKYGDGFFSSKTTLPYGINVLAISFNNRMWCVSRHGVSYSMDGVKWMDAQANIQVEKARKLLVFKDKMIFIADDAADRKTYLYHTQDGATWQKISFPLQGLDGFAAVVFQDKLWIMGGYINSVRNPNTRHFLFDEQLQRSDIDFTVRQVPSPLQSFTHRYSHTMVVFKDRLWSFGGFVDWSTKINHVFSSADGIGWRHETVLNSSLHDNIRKILVFKNRLWLFTNRAGFFAGEPFPHPMFPELHYSDTRYSSIFTSADGRTWVKGHTYAMPYTKKVAGLRVNRGTEIPSVLAFNEETGKWEIDGREIMLK